VLNFGHNEAAQQRAGFWEHAEWVHEECKKASGDFSLLVRKLLAVRVCQVGVGIIGRARFRRFGTQHMARQVLTGDKYGQESPPPTIKASLMEAILANNPANAGELKDWYQLNACTQLYCLKHPSSKYSKWPADAKYDTLPQAWTDIRVPSWLSCDVCHLIL
jgi:hypothetical protein